MCYDCRDFTRKTMWPHLNLDQALVIVSILAIVLSPLIALEVQKRLDEHRARINRKTDIFRRLMLTRATDMAPLHIEALNAIEVEFYAKDGPDKRVLDAWHIYVNHVNSPMGEGDAANRWVEKRRDFLVDLIYEMGQSLDYDIDKPTIKSLAYYPKGHWDIEVEQHSLRKAALKVFSGEAPIVSTVLGPVQVAPQFPPPDDLLLGGRQ